jgi:hypothetical protein
MINVTLMAQRYIRKKLQKLEGFVGMNASQLLKMATKMFINEIRRSKRRWNEK